MVRDSSKAEQAAELAREAEKILQATVGVSE
jgi:hypothetical protein